VTNGQRRMRQKKTVGLVLGGGGRTRRVPKGGDAVQGKTWRKLPKENAQDGEEKCTAAGASKKRNLRYGGRFEEGGGEWDQGYCSYLVQKKKKKKAGSGKNVVQGTEQRNSHVTAASPGAIVIKIQER